MTGDGVVLKYVMVEPTLDVTMPAESTVLTAQLQGDRIVLWVQHPAEQVVDGLPVLSTAAPVTRRFVAVPTGRPQPMADLTYVATVQHDGFVWHIFEQVA